MNKELIELINFQKQMGLQDPIAQEVISMEVLAPTKKKSASANLANSLVEKSTELARQAKTLPELEEAVRNFTGLDIIVTAKNHVFGEGNPNSKIVFLGEAPGANEDEQGRPFCGESGKLIDQILAQIGLSREKNCYITNSVFWRPPANRKPSAQEIAVCKPFVEKHIALINPALVVLVGATAVASVLSQNAAMSKLRQKMFDYQNQFMDNKTKVTAIFHPSYLLRQPSQKKNAWEDMLVIEDFLKEV